MNIMVMPGKLAGTIDAIPSKSHLHRLMIAATLAGQKLDLSFNSVDIQATISCVEALSKDEPELYCHESGSTLRFMLPIAAVLKDKATLVRDPGLARRPVSPLKEEMEAHGVTFTDTGDTDGRLVIEGKMSGGNFTLPGNVSSQFVTGLLMALPMADGDSTITVTGEFESRPYVDLTLEVLKNYGIKIIEDEPGIFQVAGNQKYLPFADAKADGDWSNGAFWVIANELGSSIDCKGLSAESVQGDKAVMEFKNQTTIDGRQTPDLVPILAINAAVKSEDTLIKNIGRLRIKESDRIASTAAMIRSLGGSCKVGEDYLIIHGGGLKGGTVDGANDHRIVMASAIAATVCSEPVIILGCQAVNKSYPDFFDDFGKLGGVTIAI